MVEDDVETEISAKDGMYGQPKTQLGLATLDATRIFSR
jgi:hypothetical protein